MDNFGGVVEKALRKVGVEAIGILAGAENCIRTEGIRNLRRTEVAIVMLSCSLQLPEVVVANSRLNLKFCKRLSSPVTNCGAIGL